LQRSEGVLLRYLSEVYKTLLRNIPSLNYERSLHTPDLLAGTIMPLFALFRIIFTFSEMATNPDHGSIPAPVDSE
jgi:hypothetical protein